jgi:hypothetical protein
MRSRFTGATVAARFGVSQLWRRRLRETRAAAFIRPFPPDLWEQMLVYFEEQIAASEAHTRQVLDDREEQ